MRGVADKAYPAKKINKERLVIMITKKLQEKLGKWQESFTDLETRFEGLEYEKRRLTGENREAVKIGDVDRSLQLRSELAKIEADLQELTVITEEMKAFCPVDSDLFREEFRAFNKLHTEVLDTKYREIIQTLRRLHELYTEYETIYKSYEKQLSPWKRLAEKNNGVSATPLKDRLAWLHGRTRTEIQNILRREEV